METLTVNELIKLSNHERAKYEARWQGYAQYLIFILSVAIVTLVITLTRVLMTQ